MENERSIDEVLSQFDRDQKKARVFNTTATVVGVIATIGLIALVAVIAYKYTSAEKALTVEVTQVKSELDTKSGELRLTKSELDGKKTELTRLQETVKSGSASGEVIAGLQRDLQAKEVKLVNANEHISELNKLMTTIKNPNDAIVNLTMEVAKKDLQINQLRNEVHAKDRTIAEKDKTIDDIRKKGAVKIPVAESKVNKP